jgi:ATP-dependent DNA helicase RecG
VHEIEALIRRIENQIATDQFFDQETHILEIKPCPPDRGAWDEIAISCCAFLNTRGGRILIGVTERQSGTGSPKQRRYELTGFRMKLEEKLKSVLKEFADQDGNQFNARDLEVKVTFQTVFDRRFAIVEIGKLSDLKKFASYKGVIYKREGTGDVKVTAEEQSALAAYKETAKTAFEIQPLPESKISDISLDLLNDYIYELNRTTKLETIKGDINSASSFLSREHFARENQCTLLGLLVCGEFPWVTLGFRCAVHGFLGRLDTPGSDKKLMQGNILPLMESAYQYVYEKIRVGVSLSGGGEPLPEYPLDIVRETVNNALAHRDYTIDRAVIIEINAGHSLTLRNPGEFARHSIVNQDYDGRRVKRILPNARARNPRLARILGLHNKWEGRGIGMATLVNMCLDGKIDIPRYHLNSQEVALVLRPGTLVDDGLKAHLSAIDGYIAEKLEGVSLREEETAVLAYLVKSDWQNRLEKYTVSLSPENNHQDAIARLRDIGLISEHRLEFDLRPILTVDPILSKRDFHAELIGVFGSVFAALEPDAQAILSSVYRSFMYSKRKLGTIRSTALEIWVANHDGVPSDLVQYERHKRRIRFVFKKLVSQQFIEKVDNRGFKLNILRNKAIFD